MDKENIQICKTCNRRCNGQQQYDKHMKGKEHQKKLIALNNIQSAVAKGGRPELGKMLLSTPANQHKVTKKKKKRGLKKAEDFQKHLLKTQDIFEGNAVPPRGIMQGTEDMETGAKDQLSMEQSQPFQNITHKINLKRSTNDPTDIDAKKARSTSGASQQGPNYQKQNPQKNAAKFQAAEQMDISTGDGTAVPKVTPMKSTPKKQECANEESHKRAGYTDRIHGDVYHWHFIMWLLLIAKKSGLAFALAVEYAAAGKWDDMYFKYQEKDGTWKHFYFQLKHSVGKTRIKLPDIFNGANKKLKFNDLLNSHDSIQEINNSTTFCVLNTNNCIENIDPNDGIKLIKCNETFSIPLIFDTENCKKVYLTPEKVTEIASNTGVAEVKLLIFLNDLLLATNQPNNEQLGSKLREEIGLLFEGSKAQHVFYSCFRTYIQQWMEEKTGTFIDKEALDLWIDDFPFIQKCKSGQKSVTLTHPVTDTICNKKILVAHRRIRSTG